MGEIRNEYPSNASPQNPVTAVVLCPRDVAEMRKQWTASSSFITIGGNVYINGWVQYRESFS
jgi:hypothetical protein